MNAPTEVDFQYHRDRIFERYPQFQEFHDWGEEAEQHAPRTSEELAGLWNRFPRNGEGKPLVADVPICVVTPEWSDEEVTKVMFVDIDEIVRDTAGTMMRRAGLTVDRLQNLAYDAAFNDTDHITPIGTLNSVVRGMIDGDEIDPMDDIRQSQFRLEEARHGARIIAATSTLPGGELGTIRFLEHYFGGIFSGIGFNGHYADDSRYKKSDVMMAFLEYYGGAGADIRKVGFIDDSRSHILDFRTNIDAHVPQTRDVTPRHAMNRDGIAMDGAVKQYLEMVDTPSEGLSILDTWFWKEKGVV